jgi:hypothetical protein
MKRILPIALTLVLALAVIASAAEPGKKMPMTFGVKAGICLATTSGDSLKSLMEGISQKSRFGIVGGLSFGFAPSKSFAIQPELLYVQKGTKFEAGMGDGKTTFKVDYLEIPVLIKFTPELKDSKISPALFAGPFVGLRMSGKAKSDGYGDASLDGEKDIKDSLKSTDFGITFGAGVGYKLTKGEVTFDIRYDLGFTKIIKAEAFDASSFDTKSTAIMFMVGYKFDI